MCRNNLNAKISKYNAITKLICKLDTLKAAEIDTILKIAAHGMKGSTTIFCFEKATQD